MEASIFPEVWVVEDVAQQKLPGRYLTSALRHAGIEAQFVDVTTPVADLVAAAGREPPRLVIFSVLFGGRMNDHLSIATALREAGLQAHLTLAGHLPALAYEALLATCPALDSVLCGEAESTGVQLAQALGLPEAWKAIPGIAHRGGEPPVYALATTGKLDELAPPLREEVLPTFRGYGYATVQASRGCYHGCAFCLPAAYYDRCGTPYRVRRISDLMEEIGGLYAQGARLFLFDDDEFFPPGRARLPRVSALAEEMRRRNMRIAFTIKCRPDDVELGLFQRLKELGLLRVFVGVESGCQCALDELGKQVSVAQNADALATLDDLGIVADFRSLVFNPWSTLETLEEEIAFLHRVSTRLATLLDWREVQVFPGTPVADRLVSEGRSEGTLWSIDYTIADPRAELLRRLCRLVFASDSYRLAHQFATEAWYEVLLKRRFEPGNYREQSVRSLRAIVARLNHEALEVWNEMLALARSESIYDVEMVNARASAWAERIHSEVSIRLGPKASDVGTENNLLFP